MTAIICTLAAFLYVAAVAAIALIWVLSMKHTYEDSAHEDGERIADERFREMCENTEYRVHYDRFIVCGKGYNEQEDKQITMSTQRFTPQQGYIYVNRNGGTYRCLRITPDGDPVMMNIDTGWLLTAHDCRRFADGQIDWAYSYNCKFMEGAMQLLTGRSRLKDESTENHRCRATH